MEPHARSQYEANERFVFVFLFSFSRTSSSSVASATTDAFGTFTPHPTLSQEACSAFDKHTQYKDVAQAIKKGYDARYPSSGLATDGVYHAVVGKRFGASFSHETHQYIHLKVDLNDVIIFKSKDSPFDFDHV